MRLLPLLLLLPALNVSANTYFNLSLGSRHFGESTTMNKPFNEVNPGVGISTENGSIGIYKNSFYGTSVYASYDMNYRFNSYVKVGLSAGLATGYSDHFDEKYSPFGDFVVSAYPSVFIGRSTVLKISYLPSEVPVLAFQLQWRM